jgi:hypothetical protein
LNPTRLLDVGESYSYDYQSEANSSPGLRSFLTNSKHPEKQEFKTFACEVEVSIAVQIESVLGFLDSPEANGQFRVLSPKRQAVFLTDSFRESVRERSEALRFSSRELELADERFRELACFRRRTKLPLAECEARTNLVCRMHPRTADSFCGRIGGAEWKEGLEAPPRRTLAAAFADPQSSGFSPTRVRF